MDGIHDLGGKQGFGAVDHVADEPAFHERWEAAVYACMRALASAGVLRNLDQFRHAVERIDPIAYLDHTYYGRWLGGIETLLVEGGVVSQAEIKARIRQSDGDIGRVAAQPSDAPDRVEYSPAGPGARRPLAAAPKFAVGDEVLTRATPSDGHTRLPAYARGRRGRVVAWHAGWVLPDSNAHGLGEQPAHLYTVRFSAQTLWGDEAEPGASVCVDLFEPYLHEIRR